MPSVVEAGYKLFANQKATHMKAKLKIPTTEKEILSPDEVFAFFPKSKAETGQNNPSSTAFIAFMDYLPRLMRRTK